MRFRLLAGASFALLLAIPAKSWAQTVQTFEDFTPCDNARGNVGTYGSVNYNNQFTCYAFDQPPFTAHSGTNRVYAGNSTVSNTPTGIFDFTGGPVTFDGAWFAGSTDNSVSFNLFLGGLPVWASGVLFPTDVPSFLSSGYSGMVDRVQVFGTGLNWVMDDVTFNASTSTVPEPASLTLLATGLVLVFGAARRRSRTT
jgi:hypothetical protein